MKFNWGHGIALFILAFVGFIVLMVVKAFQTSTDLTAENYYNQELAYGDRIEAIANANVFNEDVHLRINEDHLSIELPTDLIELGVKGEIHFYRPDNASLDFIQPIDGTTPFQEVPLSKLVSGKYAVRVLAASGNKEFFFEEELNYFAK